MNLLHYHKRENARKIIQSIINIMEVACNCKNGLTVVFLYCFRPNLPCSIFTDSDMNLGIIEKDWK